MAITRFRNSSIRNGTPKYNDVLAGLPFRPVIGTATDGGNGTSVSVAFTGNNVANGTITYTALSSPGSLTGTGTASPITVSGLTSGTEYTFQVKAGNSLGDSAYSAASNSVTPVTPTAFESIATATGTGSADTITFSAIPATFQHLQIRGITRNTYSSVRADFGIRLNGVTSNSYAQHNLSGNGSTVSAGNSTSTNYSFLGWAPANNATANIVGATIIDIHDYASTTKYKTIRAISGNDLNSATTDATIWLASGLFMDTTAVSSVTLRAPFGSWGTQTTFALYGIR